LRKTLGRYFVTFPGLTTGRNSALAEPVAATDRVCRGKKLQRQQEGRHIWSLSDDGEGHWHGQRRYDQSIHEGRKEIGKEGKSIITNRNDVGNVREGVILMFTLPTNQTPIDSATKVFCNTSKFMVVKGGGMGGKFG
jgi:hypothetical protein